MHSQDMVISKRGPDGFEPVGKITIFIPTMEDMGITVETKGEDDEGLPVYADDRVQWTYKALVAAVKAKARNALVSGTAQLKPGQSIADTVEAIIAEGQRGGGGEALAAIRELKKAYAAWISSLGLSAKAVAMHIQYFGNREALSLQDNSMKEKVQARVVSFAEQLDADMLQAGKNYLDSVLQACEPDDDDDLPDDM